jgi:hypothetical protein
MQAELSSGSFQIDCGAPHWYDSTTRLDSTEPAVDGRYRRPTAGCITDSRIHGFTDSWRTLNRFCTWTSSQQSGIEKERREALFDVQHPSPTSCTKSARTAVEHKKSSADGKTICMIPAHNGQIAPAIGVREARLGIDRWMSDGEQPGGILFHGSKPVILSIAHIAIQRINHTHSRRGRPPQVPSRLQCFAGRPIPRLSSISQ